eukprot:1811176-Pyramimonas_sp.AAC.1
MAFMCASTLAAVGVSPRSCKRHLQVTPPGRMMRLPATMGPTTRPRTCRARASRHAGLRANTMRPTGGANQEAH